MISSTFCIYHAALLYPEKSQELSFTGCGCSCRGGLEQSINHNMMIALSYNPWEYLRIGVSLSLPILGWYHNSPHSRVPLSYNRTICT